MCLAVEQLPAYQWCRTTLYLLMVADQRTSEAQSPQILHGVIATEMQSTILQNETFSNGRQPSILRYALPANQVGVYSKHRTVDTVDYHRQSLPEWTLPLHVCRAAHCTKFQG